MSKNEWAELDFEEALRTGQIPFRGFTSLCENLGPEMAAMKPDFYGPDDPAVDEQLTQVVHRSTAASCGLFLSVREMC